MLLCCSYKYLGWILQSLDKALKFSFEEPHIWSQYALTFHAGGFNTRKSTLTTLEAAKLSKKPTPLLLLGAQQLFCRYEVCLICLSLTVICTEIVLIW